MNIKNNLILALDVMSESEAIEICDSINEYIDTIKIGYPMALAEGLEIINKLKDKFGFKVICDFKVADIDATNEKICDETFKAGADAIICHGFVGSDSVQACLDMANKHGKELFLLTEMSHPEPKCFCKKMLMQLPRWALIWELQTMLHRQPDLTDYQIYAILLAKMHISSPQVLESKEETVRRH